MPAREQLLERDPRLDLAHRQEPRLGHAEVQRHVRAFAREALVRLDHLRRVGVLERDHEVREAEAVEQRAVVDRAGDHRADRVARESARRTRARPSRSSRRRAARSPRSPATSAIHATLSRMLRAALVVVQVAGVVAQLRDVRRDRGREPVVLLQVDDERHAVRAWISASASASALLSTATRTSAAPALAPARSAWRDRGGDVLGVRRAHALHRDRRAAADLDGAGAHRAGGVAWVCDGSRPNRSTRPIEPAGCSIPDARAPESSRCAARLSQCVHALARLSRARGLLFRTASVMNPNRPRILLIGGTYRAPSRARAPARARRSGGGVHRRRGRRRARLLPRDPRALRPRRNSRAQRAQARRGDRALARGPHPPGPRDRARR